MTAHELAIIGGGIGATLALIMAIPQAWKIWRDRSYVGVSELSWWLFVMSNSLWLGYAVRERNTVIIVSSFLSLLTSVALLIGIQRVAPRTARREATSAGVAALAVACMCAGLWAPLVVLVPAVTLGGLVRAPQVYRSFRTWRDRTPTEVSFLTWWASLTSGFCWSVHGIFWPDLAITISSLAVIILSASVLVLEYAAAARARTVLACMTA